MKKIILLVALIIVAQQLKAQTSYPLNPSDTATSAELYKQYFYNPDDTALKPSMWLSKTNPLTLQPGYLAGINPSSIDHMPIAKLYNNSTMLIYKPAYFSNMPIINPATQQLFVKPKYPAIVVQP